MFLSYKTLKKQLKLIYPKPGDEPPAKRPRCSHDDEVSSGAGAVESNEEEEAEVTKEVAEFLKLLDDEIEKFNEFFVQKEEDYVIAWKVMLFKKKII